ILLAQQGMLSLFTDTIMPSTETLIAMTTRGIRVHTDRLAAWRQALVAKIDILHKEWVTHAPHVDPKSSHKLKKYLYYELGLPFQYNPQTKELSTDESALRSLISLSPGRSNMLTCLLNLRKANKLYGTYAKIETSDDHCVHPSYPPTNRNVDAGAASTGRIASSGPNIQNQTPESKLLFIPHHAGWSLIECDFSQIELRIAAALAADQALIKALEGDVHAHTMDNLRCDRTRAKNIIYGTLYGAGPRKLARILRTRGLETTEGECLRLQNALAHLYPDLWAWRASVALS